MAYRISLRERVGDTLREIAASQIAKALAEVDDSSLAEGETVHRVRKRCKKIRGLLRLFRGPLEEAGVYESENERFRGAARRLGDMRDGDVLMATLDGLQETFSADVEDRLLGRAREGLEEYRQKLKPGKKQGAKLLSQFRKDLVSAEDRLGCWQAGDGFAAVRDGLERTYGRARTAHVGAFREKTPEAFHEWRKRVKYHGYHIRLLRDLWPEMLSCRRKLLEQLGELLGLDHDLAVLREIIADEPARFGEGQDVHLTLALIDARRAMLEAETKPLGDRLFVEKPKRFAQRVEDLWCVAAEEADAPDKATIGSGA